MALPRSMRFTSRQRVGQAIRRGRSIMSPIGRITARPAEPDGGRILFVVSKRVSKKSTERNRIKRRLGEWARQQFGTQGRTHDVVVFVNPLLAELTKKEFHARTAEAVIYMKRAVGL